MTLRWLVCILSLFFLHLAQAQPAKVTLSGSVRDASSKSALSFVNVTLKLAKDSSLVAGTISGEDGRFTFPDLSSGSYVLVLTYIAYQPKMQPVLVGQLTNYLDLGNIELS
ncbi:MAG: carboxypeptidase regulatory-like domain-containing protein, partial [Chitinophagaceae bacterium]|nr:carboxypeptidase regulatory-like domain-containing protein [Chitinophagaceae bacterium]